MFGVSLPDYLGSRNGLFYGFPYIALGMVTAKSASQGKTDNRKKLYTGFFISFLLLIIESYLFVIHFKTDATILWLSVFPYTYFFFRIVNNIDIQINQKVSYTFRKMSTLLYVSQFLFIPVLSRYLSNVALFLAAVISTVIFSLIIIKLSELRYLSFLKYLYWLPGLCWQMNYMELVWYQLVVVIIIHMDNTPRKPISEGFFLQHYHIPRWIKRKYERS